MDNEKENRGLFNINRCFTCSKSAVETTLKRCGACKMISYCCEDHQRKDWKNHKTFCGVIKRVEKSLPQQNLNDKKVWFHYKCAFTKLCERDLGRALEQHEREMIAYPKRCEICRSFNANIICKDCLGVNYCSEEHRDRDLKFHSENCADLKKAIDKNFFTSDAGDVIWNWSLCKGVLKLTDNMQDFMRLNINMGKIQNPNQRQISEIVLSTNITYPLSLLHGINLLNFEVKDKLVVHIVGSELQETIDLQKWEIIKHVFPQIKDLMIFFVGPNVGGALRSDLCSSCKKVFKFKMIKDLYHDFVKSSEYLKPDIICTFHPGFYASKAQPSFPWLKSLRLLFKGSPLIMTSFNKLEVEFDVEILLGVDQNLVIKKMKNPFAGLMPMRSLEDSIVNYLNNYITLVYKDPAKI